MRPGAVRAAYWAQAGVALAVGILLAAGCEIGDNYIATLCPDTAADPADYGVVAFLPREPERAETSWRGDGFHPFWPLGGECERTGDDIACATTYITPLARGHETRCIHRSQLVLDEAMDGMTWLECFCVGAADDCAQTWIFALPPAAVHGDRI